jgi:hypothetical protein
MDRYPVGVPEQRVRTMQICSSRTSYSLDIMSLLRTRMSAIFALKIALTSLINQANWNKYPGQAGEDRSLRNSSLSDGIVNRKMKV